MSFRIPHLSRDEESPLSLRKIKMRLPCDSSGYVRIVYKMQLKSLISVHVTNSEFTMNRQFLRYCILLFVFQFISIGVFSQSKRFIAGALFNANGIEIKGNKEILWQTSKGGFCGTGGLSAGVYVKREIKNRIYLSLELRYIRKGCIYIYLNQYGTQAAEVLKLNYFEIPLLVGYTFHINKASFLFETGPALARLFSSKLSIGRFVYRNNNPQMQNFRDQDLSWIGSLKIPLNQKGKQNILLGLRFSYSLFSIHNAYKLRNMDYGIQLDYVFNNGRKRKNKT
jgi:hypothetical protein